MKNNTWQCKTCKKQLPASKLKEASFSPVKLADGTLKTIYNTFCEDCENKAKARQFWKCQMCEKKTPIAPPKDGTILDTKSCHTFCSDCEKLTTEELLVKRGYNKLEDNVWVHGIKKQRVILKRNRLLGEFQIHKDLIVERFENDKWNTIHDYEKNTLLGVIR